MDVYRCVKCNEPMDEGYLSLIQAGAGARIGYVSNRQTGMIRRPTLINRLFACSNCGYVELFLNPGELKQKLG